jgi:integrase
VKPEAAYDVEHLNSCCVHTPGHENCPGCFGAHVYQTLSAHLLFPDAFDLWIAHREVSPDAYASDISYLSAKTIKDYRTCAVALGKFFAKLPLNKIHPGNLTAYQNARALNILRVSGAKGVQETHPWVKRAGANRIRKEIDLLRQILRSARLWGDEEKRSFVPLRRVENDVPRAMQPEEQDRFLRVAASKEPWQFVYWYSVLALRTTASTNELRSLRIGDVLLSQGVLQIRREGAKNKYRMRTIPLETPDVIWALERLIERAKAMGAAEPYHYLFPVQESRGKYDPTHPMSDSGLKKRWADVRSAAGLEWLRPYDLRHTAITRMAEAGTPIQIIMAFAGHMTLRMQQHYTAISMMAKRKWARSVWGEDVSAIGPQLDRSGWKEQVLRSA